MKSVVRPSGRRVMLFALAALLLAVVVAIPPGTAQAAEARPFDASFTLRVVQHVQLDPLHIYEEQAGSGNATHLGLTTITLSQVVDLTNIPTTGCIGLDGSGTLVAANGDQVYFTFDGPACFQPDGSIAGTQAVSFTGGSGRFQGATGSASMVGGFRNGVVSVQWPGTISY